MDGRVHGTWAGSSGTATSELFLKLGAAVNDQEETPQKKIQVFVISPIGADGDDVRKHADLFLSHIVRAALPADEYDVRRADEDDSPYAITEAMLGRILEADICVADITGLNPNVMYELALAHAADKKVIVMTRDNAVPPFDIKDFRIIKYGLRVDEAKEAVRQLTEKAAHTTSPTAFERMLNPVASAFREWTDRQKIDAENDGSDQAMLRLIDRLDQKVDRLVGATKLTGGESALLAESPSDVYEDDQNAVEYYLRELRGMRQEISSWPNPAVRDSYGQLLAEGLALRSRLRSDLPVGENRLRDWHNGVLDLLSASDR